MFGISKYFIAGLTYLYYLLKLYVACLMALFVCLYFYLCLDHHPKFVYINNKILITAIYNY